MPVGDPAVTLHECEFYQAGDRAAHLDAHVRYNVFVMVRTLYPLNWNVNIGKAGRVSSGSTAQSHQAIQLKLSMDGYLQHPSGDAPYISSLKIRQFLRWIHWPLRHFLHIVHGLKALRSTHMTNKLFFIQFIIETNEESLCSPAVLVSVIYINTNGQMQS